MKTGSGGGFFIEIIAKYCGTSKEGGPPPPSLDVPSGFAGNDPRDYKTDQTSGVSHPKMASRQDDLLQEFEEFEADHQVEDILKKDGIRDQGVTAFGEQLKDEHFLFMLSFLWGHFIVSQGCCESRQIIYNPRAKLNVVSFFILIKKELMFFTNGYPCSCHAGPWKNKSYVQFKK